MTPRRWEKITIFWRRLVFQTFKTRHPKPENAETDTASYSRRLNLHELHCE